MQAMAQVPGARTWTVMDTIPAAADYLSKRGVADSRLDAEHLLAHLLGMKRLDLYLCHDRPLGSAELAGYRQLVRRRGKREPLQYVMGSAPFRDLHLAVDRRVAIPRPETEYFLDMAADLVGPDSRVGSALDVGTGSGAIALALATEKRAARVVATDISAAALTVARHNARVIGASGVDFRVGPELGPVEGETFDLILCNAPYLGESEWRDAQPEVREWEPKIAMVAGGDGLAVIRALVARVAGSLRPGGWFGLEIGPAQGAAVEALVRGIDGLRRVGVHHDLTGRCRYVFGQMGGEDHEHPLNSSMTAPIPESLVN